MNADELILSPELVRFIEDMGLYYENHNIPRIGGRIFGLLLVAPRPLLAEEIAAHLGVARSSVSTNIRLLITAGLVSRSSQPGDRRDFFSIPASAWSQGIAGRIHSTQAVQPLLDSGLAALPDGYPARQRLEKMHAWTQFLIRMYQRALKQWNTEQAKEEAGSQDHPTSN